MSDYYPLLSRIVAGLDTDTGESRRALYGRARAALCEQLRGQEPPLTESEITHERLSLEAAIRKFEAEAIRRRQRPAGDLGSTAIVEAVEVRPLETVPVVVLQAEPPRTTADARPIAQRPAPPEQLVELALLAQVAEAREQHVRGAPEAPSATAGAHFLGAARQRVRAVVQRIFPAPQPQQGTAQDVLTKLVQARQDFPANRFNPGARLRSRSLSDAPPERDFITPVLWFLYLVLGFAQLVAFFHGLQTGFGLGGVASIGIFMLLYLTGSVGSIPMAMVSFYGAWRGWQWPIWGAALLAFPFVILSFAFLGFGGFYSFFNRKKTPPAVRLLNALAESPWWRERARRWRAALPRFAWSHPGAPGWRPRRPRSRR